MKPANLSTTVILQITAAFFQVVVTQIPVIPHEWMPVIHGFIGFLSTSQAILAHLAEPKPKPQEAPKA